MRSETNHLLDCIKGIACICVVFIHVHFPGQIGEVISHLSGFAVPIFFMTSGYFVYNCTNIVLKKRVKRILWLSAWTTALYWIIINFIKYFLKQQYVCQGGTDVLLLMTRFIFLQDVDFSGGFHLWFLWALFWSYIIAMVINHFDLWGRAYHVLPFLIILKVILAALREYYGLDFHSTANISTAITYILIGHYLAANRDKVKMVTNHKLIFFIILGFIIRLGMFLHPVYDFTQLGTIMASVAIFTLAVNNKDFVISKKLEIIGYRYSLNIYVFHILVSNVLTKIEIIAGIHDNMLVMATQPILVVLSTLVLALAIHKISTRRNSIKL